ncbi:MAG TPA: DNA-binding response regulator, partial [Xanthomonadales bacterium]|nr:DNA-binding response regulator [Xanthomonadales bacterium]
MKVLIVDDDVELAGLLRMALSQDGYAVDVAYDGLEALRRFTATPSDLVVLDVNLPALDGYGVLAELRRRSDVPVLMLTVRAAEEDEVRGLDLGADD